MLIFKGVSGAECDEHKFTGLGSKEPPSLGCKNCATATLWTIYLGRKGDKQGALDEMEAIMHGACEMEEELTDYTSIKPEVTIEHDDN